jgi:hypothetical protein
VALLAAVVLLMVVVVVVVVAQITMGGIPRRYLPAVGQRENDAA